MDQDRKILFSQLLVGQSHSLKSKNLVELNFQPICKQHGSLWRGKGGILAFLGHFFYLKKEQIKICNFGIMAHYRMGVQQFSDFCYNIFCLPEFARRRRKKIVCCQLCYKGKMSVLQYAIFPLTSCIHSLRPCGKNFQQHCYFTFTSELILKLPQWHYESKLSVILSEETA